MSINLIVSVGLLVGAYSCGIAFNILELNKSEARLLVGLFSIDTNAKIEKKIEYICYDDACHIPNEIKTTELNNVKFVIDRFHLRNHKEECKVKYNYANYSELKHVNTQVCEQIF